jgi:hypothetical protein
MSNRISYEGLIAAEEYRSVGEDLKCKLEVIISVLRSIARRLVETKS